MLVFEIFIFSTVLSNSKFIKNKIKALVEMFYEEEKSMYLKC